MDEFAIIGEIFKSLTNDDENSLGLLDDVAIIPETNGKLLFTTDTIVQDTHFLAMNSFFDIGYKLAAVNISDIIAKGAVPIAGFLNFTAPRNLTIEQVSEFTSGLNKARSEYGNFPILGGDTTTTDGKLTLGLSLIGRTIRKPIFRNGAKVGDGIYVTGNIGDAFIGLNALRKMNGFEKYSDVHYNTPKPPNIKIANIIAQFANSSMDVSDGLLGDTQKLIIASGVGCDIDLANIPLSNDGKDYTKANIEKLLELISFGDDYQTLFTASIDSENEILNLADTYQIKITKIGFINNNCNLAINYNKEYIKLPKKLSYEHKIT